MLLLLPAAGAGGAGGGEVGGGRGVGEDGGHHLLHRGLHHDRGRDTEISGPQEGPPGIPQEEEGPQAVPRGLAEAGRVQGRPLRHVGALPGGQAGGVPAEGRLREGQEALPPPRHPHSARGGQGPALHRPLLDRGDRAALHPGEGGFPGQAWHGGRGGALLGGGAGGRGHREAAGLD